MIEIVLSDPAKDIFITLDGKKVAVPQGKAQDQPQYSNSSFSNSEYLIYKESQCRIRYLLELHMSYWKERVLVKKNSLPISILCSLPFP